MSKKLFPWLLAGLFLTAGCDDDDSGATPTQDAAPSTQDGSTPTCESTCTAGARRCDDTGQIQLCADYTGDGCAEWGGDVVCPAGADCLDGACIAGCQDSCAEGEAVCGEGGRRACGDADGDGCREFLPAVPCAASERCDNGACVPSSQPCEDACAVDGERACDGDRYRTCGQHDDDTCLDWSISIQCQPGNRCDGAGECVPDCTDDCEAGSTLCQGEGVTVCGNFDRDICLELGPVTACRADERCDNGACVPEDQACENECQAEGARVCDGQGFRQCGQYDADECWELSAVVPCAGFEACQEGACVATCQDECVRDTRQCRGDGAALCGNFDPDPCLEWSSAQACQEGETCDDGRCLTVVDPCEDACTADAVRCGVGGVERCANVDADACLEWSAAAPCQAGTRCEEGRCVDDCTDACAQGAVQCLPGGLATCGNFDSDDCLEWGTAVACPEGQSCSGGQCRLTCVDDCAQEGLRTCTAAGEIKTCGRFDADACLDWSSATPCAANQTCTNGACVAVCQDECAANDRRCVGQAYEICGNFDADGCLDFGGGASCGAGEICEAGACQIDCDDECADGASECVDDGARTCGNFDADACLEWGTAQACGAHQTCTGGVCDDLPAPEGVVINEIFYDAETTPEREHTFIELYGEPGLSLTGLTLVAINGNGGLAYGTLELAGTIPADGFFVITHPDAASLANVRDQSWTGADLQNGPDTLQLRWGAQVVDAIAYGTFTANDVQAGEGAPAAGAIAGKSLTRNARHDDTDDNRQDFALAIPSPGAALPCQDTCATEGETRCVEDAVETCGLGAMGCLEWATTSDCAAAGELCVDGACEPAPTCLVPTAITATESIAGVYAQNPCIDVIPMPGAGFAVVGAAPTNGVTFALTNLAGVRQTAVQYLGNTNWDAFGRNASATFYPKMIYDGAQFAVVWMAFNRNGNSDILFRRVTAAGVAVPTANPVINNPSFNPIISRRADGSFDVLHYAYTRIRRNVVSAIGEPSAVEEFGTVSVGDTREDAHMARARSTGGQEALLYIANTNASYATPTPKALFQAIGADGRASGNRVDLGDGWPASGYPGAYLFALPNNQFGAVWAKRVGAVNPVIHTVYTVLSTAGVVQSQVDLNELDRASPAYLPHMYPISAIYDGERIGVLHYREAAAFENAHYMIQWITPAGVHISRTELGSTLGVLSRHPDDGLFRVFEPRGTGVDMRVHTLGCP